MIFGSGAVAGLRCAGPFVPPFPLPPVNSPYSFKKKMEPQLNPARLSRNQAM
jgi:hypothetical protein